VTIVGDEYMNPDDEARSQSVVLWLLRLKDDRVFRDADFETLWRDTEGTLKGDLVGRRETTVYPAEKVTGQLTDEDGARFVATMGLFRRIDGDSWRRVFPFPPDDGPCPASGPGPARSVTLNVYGSEVTVAVAPPRPVTTAKGGTR
jgi:type VI secretion system protein VasD